MKILPHTLYSVDGEAGYIYTLSASDKTIHYIPIQASPMLTSKPHYFLPDSTISCRLTPIAASTLVPHLDSLTLDDLHTYFPEIFL